MFTEPNILTAHSRILSPLGTQTRSSSGQTTGMAKTLSGSKILMQAGTVSEPKSRYKLGFPHLNLSDDLLSKRHTRLTESQRITGLNLKSKLNIVCCLERKKTQTHFLLWFWIFNKLIIVHRNSKVQIVIIIDQCFFIYFYEPIYREFPSLKASILPIFVFRLNAILNNIF